MRYTARGRNVVWRDDHVTREAAHFLKDILESGDPLVVRYTLEPGQGVICNNVLHTRTGFTNRESPGSDDGRLLYRARYLDRVAGT